MIPANVEGEENIRNAAWTATQALSSRSKGQRQNERRIQKTAICSSGYHAREKAHRGPSKPNHKYPGGTFVQVITIKIFDAKSLEHHVGIEIVGTRENVMMAEYVYHFLIQQTDYLVSEIAKTRPLSRVQRKSYKLGILVGFSEKLRETERAKTVKDSLSLDAGPGLITLALAKFHKDKALDRYLANIYPRLSSNRGSTQYVDGSAFLQGQSVGGTITLHKAVTNSNGNREHLLNE